MDEIVTELDIRILSVTLAVDMFVAWEIGRRMGLRDKGHTRSSKFDDGAMALPGLLIALPSGCQSKGTIGGG